MPQLAALWVVEGGSSAACTTVRTSVGTVGLAYSYEGVESASCLFDLARSRLLRLEERYSHGPGGDTLLGATEHIDGLDLIENR